MGHARSEARTTLGQPPNPRSGFCPTPFIGSWEEGRGSPRCPLGSRWPPLPPPRQPGPRPRSSQEPRSQPLVPPPGAPLPPRSPAQARLARSAVPAAVQPAAGGARAAARSRPPSTRVVAGGRTITARKRMRRPGSGDTARRPPRTRARGGLPTEYGARWGRADAGPGTAGRDSVAGAAAPARPGGEGRPLRPRCRDRAAGFCRAAGSAQRGAPPARGR